MIHKYFIIEDNNFRAPFGTSFFLKKRVRRFLCFSLSASLLFFIRRIAMAM